MPASRSPQQARDVLERAVGLGHGDDDFASLITVLEADAGREL